MKTIINLLIMVWFVVTLQAQAQHELNKRTVLNNLLGQSKLSKHDQLEVPTVYNPFNSDNQLTNTASKMALDSLHYNDINVNKMEVGKFRYDLKGRVLSENYNLITKGRTQELLKIIHEYDDTQLRYTVLSLFLTI